MCRHQPSRTSISRGTGAHTTSRLDKLCARKDKVCSHQSSFYGSYPEYPTFRNCLQSPFYFVVANLVRCNQFCNDKDQEPLENYLVGTTVSSLYRLRDMDNTGKNNGLKAPPHPVTEIGKTIYSDGGFFVFGDLSVRKEGDYKLHFSLFEIVE